MALFWGDNTALTTIGFLGICYEICFYGATLSDTATLDGSSVALVAVESKLEAFVTITIALEAVASFETLRKTWDTFWISILS